MTTTSSVNTASDIRTDYMKLLVTQLQHQDPTAPMDSNQMASQLTMFSQLEQLETMNSSFSKALDSAQRSYANSLLGKEVSFADPQNVSAGVSSGIVNQAYAGADGKLMLTVGLQSVALEDILSVQNPSNATMPN